MKIHRSRLILCLGLLGGLVTSVIASTPSPVQSTLRPLGLPIVKQVQLSGSDSQSQAFEAVKAGYQKTCAAKLPEGVAFTGEALNQLDPQRLYFMFDYAPRVYFLAEGACYTDALGATIATAATPTNTPLKGNTFTIFPSTHCSLSTVCSTGSGNRTQAEPLLSGDFVQLPTVKAGQQLQFFLMANMDSSGKPADTYYNGTTTNPDDFQHMIAFFPDNNSQYIIIGFEDMYGGGDKDCNDVLYVVDVGPNNAALFRNPNTLPR
ncbi:MAG TPA: DUF4114 domain-containing protein [Planctomycetaceae bacterium]